MPDLVDGGRQQFVHDDANLLIGLGDAGRVEIGAHLAKHIVVPRFFEVRADPSLA